MTNLVVIPSTAVELKEPNWAKIIPDGDGVDNAEWRELAHEKWDRIISELRSRGTLSVGNYDQILRLVHCYLRFAQAATEYWRMGLVTKAPKTGVAKANIYRSELRQAEHDAMKEEAELGLSPRRRGAVTKATNKKGVGTAADSYLGRPIRDK